MVKAWSVWIDDWSGLKNGIDITIAESVSDSLHQINIYQFAGEWPTLWLFNIAMENGPFIDDFPIKTSIYKGFSMAMLNNQMVNPIVLVNAPGPNWCLNF